MTTVTNKTMTPNETKENQMNAQLAAIDPLQEAEERLREERAKLRTEHAKLARLDTATHAADDLEQQIAALDAEERDAIAQWSAAGADGRMPVPDVARREALMKKLARERATANAARLAYKEAEARYIEQAERCKDAETGWLHASLLKHIDRAGQLRKEMLVHLAGAELVLQEVEALRVTLQDPRVANLRERAQLWAAMVHAANIPNDELMQPVVGKIPGLRAQAEQVITLPAFDDAN